MATIFTTILNMSLTACIIILIVLLARQCLKKVPKIFSYVLWSVVLFRLLCPVSISLPVSILAPMSGVSTSAGTSYTASMEYISLPERNESEQMQQPVPGENGTQGNAAGADADASTAPLSPIAPETSTSPAVVEQKMSAGEIVLTVLGWVWVAGMAGVLGLTAWQTISLKRRLADACIVRGNIFESDNIDTAFVLGVINPKIYLPLGLPFDVQKAVVAHEQTHQRRGDHIVKLVSYIALAIHWFNPLVWLSFKLMCDDMEKSCDEAVIRTFYNRGYPEKNVKKGYSEMLFALGGGKQHIFSPVSFAEHSVKERIINVAKFKRIGGVFAVALGAVCIAIVGICIVNPDNTALAAYSGMDFIEAQKHSADAVKLTIGDVTFWSDDTELDLSNQEIADISSLSVCSNLEYLNLANTGITDISVLSELPALRRLNLSDNCTMVYDEAQKRKIPCSTIADWSLLSELTALTELDLKFAGFYDASYLSNLTNLVSLDLSYNSYLTDISPLSNLKSLEFLGLNGSAWGYYQTNSSRLIHGYFFDIDHLFIYGEITDISCLSALQNLKTLEISSQIQINDFSCLSECKNLQKINALNSSLTDISFISKIPIKELIVPQCDIEDFTPLSDCKDIISLNLSSTDFSDTSLLTSFKDLKSLNLSNIWGSTGDPSIGSYQILELEYLSELTQLEELNLERTQISDISSLSGLVNLEVLDISDNDISDISALSGMSELEVLDVSGNYNISRATSVSGMQNLKQLNINRTTITQGGIPQNLSSLEKLYIEDVWPLEGTIFLKGYESLNTLVIDNSNIYGISGLADMKKLEHLDLSKTSILSLPEISEAKTLKQAYLYRADENTINALSSLKELRRLSMEICVGDIQNLSKLKKLESLEIKSSNSDDFSALSNLTKLKKLVISSNKLTDISFVSKLDRLEHLSFARCSNLSDISPLADIPQIINLDLSNCSIEDITVLSSFKYLEDINLSDNKISDATPLHSLQDAALNRGASSCSIARNNLTDEQIIELDEILSRCVVYPSKTHIEEEKLLNQ